jgi:hypothetical protein
MKRGLVFPSLQTMTRKMDEDFQPGLHAGTDFGFSALLFLADLFKNFQN